MPTRSESDNSGDRPFPDFPRNPATTRIYALLVGINDYPHPVPVLNGCLKDVEQVEAYLLAKFGQAVTTGQPETVGAAVAATTTVAAETRRPNRMTRRPRPGSNGSTRPPRNGPARAEEESDEEQSALPIEVIGRLHLCKLVDSDATYRNILTAFDEHLSQAGENDTVWFHFSGHGAEQVSAQEFRDAGGERLDQTLVCYRSPEDTEAPLFLADKELAVLLDRLSVNRPHIVVSLDSCHSGSGTREVLDPPGVLPRAFNFLAARETEAAALLPDATRSLDSYIDGFYTNTLEVPSVPHVRLAGCQVDETSGDMPQGGVFTTSLMNVLNDTNQPIHYARLFTKTRSRVKKIRTKQTPQFDVLDGFDPYTCFLEGWPMAEIPEYYEVFQDNGEWFVRCGALHGLPVASDQPIRAMISKDVVAAENGNLTKIAAQLEKVGAQHSKIKFLDEADRDRMTAETDDGTPIDYIAEILALPAAPIYVNLTGETEAIARLTLKWDGSKNVLIAAPDDGETPALSVEATPGNSFIIRNALTGRRFVEVPEEAGTLDRRVDLTIQNLNKIVRWHRTILLDNPKTKIRDWFDFELQVFERSGNSVVQSFHSDKEVKLFVSEDNLVPQNGFAVLGFNFRLTMKQDQQDLFAYAFDLTQDCAIQFQGDEEKKLRVAEMNIGDQLFLRSAPMGWGPDDDEDVVTRWFKVIITTEEMDHHQLTQTALIGDKDGEVTFFNPFQISDDWCTETIQVTLVRRKDEVPAAGSEADIPNSNITVIGRSGITAEIALSTSDQSTNSNDPANKLADFEQLGFDLIDLKTSDKVGRQNVLELNELVMDPSTTLAAQPLEIVLAEQLQADEYLLPVAFDGEHFRVIGYAVPDGDQTIVRIRELPTARDTATARTQIGFFKAALRKKS